MVNLKRRGSGTIRKAALQIGVAYIRLGGGIEAKRESRNNVTTARDGVEQAGAISKATGILRQIDKLETFQIEGVDHLDGARDLLPVSSNILNWAAADQARDAGKALATAHALLTNLANEAVPICSSGGAEHVTVLFSLRGNANVQDQAGKAFVRNKQITPSAHGKETQIAATGELNSFGELGGIRDTGEKARRSAHPQCCVGRKRDPLLHVERRHRLRVQ